MIGITPRASMVSNNSSVPRETPEAPRARLASLSAIINRTTASGEGSPTPAAWDNTILRCSVARSPAAIRTLASLPKPVFTP